MSDKPISDLRRRMIADMTVRSFGDKMQHDYIRHVEAFARFLGRSPDSATGDSWVGGNNYWSASYSRRTKLLYIPSDSKCSEATLDPDAARSETGSMRGGVPKYIGRSESDIVVVDPFTGEVKKKARKPYPNRSAALTMAGGLFFTGLIDGSFAAYDDISLEQLWEVNVGVGLNAP